MERDYIISWKVAGISLGLLLTLATALVQPLGVSTQFVVTDAVILKQVAPDLVERNDYLSQAGDEGNWGESYAWMLVFGMLVGGGLTSLIFRKWQPQADQGSMPPMWQARFGPSRARRYIAAFGGGVLLLFGARLAGGCTSGHMISGISQLAISSFIFGIVAFTAAILMAKWMYRSEQGA
jgi:uncharacterized protein